MFFAGLVGARAQTVEFDVQPRVLRMNEQATATFTFKDVRNPPTPSLPEVPGLLFGRPNVSQQSSFAFGAQGQRSEQSVVYAFPVLPVKPGAYTLAPSPLLVNGQPVQLPEISIQVAPADGAKDQAASWREQVFVRMKPSRTELYVQEVFEVEFALYFRHVRLDGNINLLNLPSSGVAIVGQQELGPGREIVDNLVYDVRRFRIAFRTLTRGEFNFEPVLRVQVLAQTPSRSRPSLFDDFFAGASQRVPVDLAVEPAVIRVKAIPEEGRPSDYADAVGQFQFRVQARPQEVKVGDPVTLSLLVEGRGNIDSVSMPTIPFPDGFRVYEAKMTGREYNTEGTQGRKLFEQVVIPRSTDITALPPVSFSFFDPETGRYQTLRHDAIPLRVLPSGQDGPQVVADGSSEPAELRVVGENIAYLKPAPRHWQRRAATSRWTLDSLAMHALPGLAAVAALLRSRHRRRLSGDQARMRRLKAPKVARRSLSAAESALASGARSACFQHLWEALAAYFGHRFNLPPGEVEPQRVAPALRGAGLDERHADCVEALFSLCDRERFGASSSADWSDAERGNCADRIRQLKEALRACERIRL